METSLEVSRNLLCGIIRYVRTHDTWTLDLTPGGIAEQRLPEIWNGQGIIARIPSLKEAGKLAAHPAPKVILDPQTPFTNPNHPLSKCVRLTCDHDAIGREAARHFMHQGFKKFAYIGPVLSSTIQMQYDGMGTDEPNWSIARREAFAAHLADHNFECFTYPLPGSKRISSNWNLEMPRVVKWLQRLPKPIAIFTAHDARGRQIADACHVAKIPVPYSLAILSVNNDSTLCETSQPPLSSIPLDAESTGYLAAELLDGLIKGKEPQQRQILYPPLPVAKRASSSNTQTDDPLVIDLLEEIREAKGFNLRVSELANRRHVTVRTLENHCRKAIGRSVGDIVRETCMENIYTLVAKSDMPFSEIAQQSGQRSPSHLAAMFRKRFETTMTAARHGFHHI